METIAKTKDKQLRNQSKISPDEVACLPKEILIAAAKCADRDRARGTLIPHSKVLDIIATKRGWK
jgi:hypothetical protein